MAHEALLEHCVELLAHLGRVRSRRMFGGHGLYIDDLFVALIAFERLYLKASAATRPDFEAAGCSPFEYERQGRTAALGYWTAPPDAMDSPDAMQPWARRAIQAALAARSRAKAVRPRRARGAPAAGAAPRRR
jgi:DNA transformation protein